ncbi:hypothetical protein AAHC03_020992 [Spirometra sp. Aus1]
MIPIAQVLATLLLSLQYAGRCESSSVCDLWTGGDWKFVGTVATSLNPTIWLGSHSVMIRGERKPKSQRVWKIGVNFPAAFTPTNFTVEEKSAALDTIKIDKGRMQITSPKVDGCLCISIKRKALQGESFMKRCLQIYPEWAETKYKLRIEIQPLTISSRVATAYAVHWRSLPDFPSYSILLYNSTHMKQLVQEQSPLLLSNLRRGTTYHVCIRPYSQSPQSTCKSWTTMMLPPDLVDENAHQLFKLSPSVEGQGKSWVQLSWPPPSIRGPHLLPPPEGYLVIVSRRGYSTPDHVYQLLIPWGSKKQWDELRKQANEVLFSLRYTKSLGSAKLDVPWPDYKSSRRSFWIDGWNAGSVDDMGPQNLFVVTVSGLANSETYNFTIVPLFLPGPRGINLLRFASSIEATTGGQLHEMSLNSIVTSMRDTDFVDLQRIGLGSSKYFKSSVCRQIEHGTSQSSITTVVSTIQCYRGSAANLIQCLKDLSRNATYRVILRRGLNSSPVLKGIFQTPSENSKLRRGALFMTSCLWNTFYY